jgi:flavorubredoxin
MLHEIKQLKCLGRLFAYLRKIGIIFTCDIVASLSRWPLEA